MKAVKVSISFEFIKHLMVLPEGCEITGSVCNKDHLRYLDLIIESPEFPEVIDGIVVQAQPIFERREPVILKEWNILK